MSETPQTTGAFLGRSALLQKRPRRTKCVQLPELGGAVIVRELSALERGQYEAYFRSRSGETHLQRLARARHKLIVMTVIDENGHRLFSDDDLKALDSLPASVAERITQAAQELSAVSDDDLDELAKNSEATDG